MAGTADHDNDSTSSSGVSQEKIHSPGNHLPQTSDVEKLQFAQVALPAVPNAIPGPLTRLDSQLPSKRDQKDKPTEDKDPFAHLPEDEKAVLFKQLDVPAVKVTYFTLFRYATRNDKIVMGVSGSCAIIGGALLPLMTVLFGSLAGTFQHFFLGTITQSEFNSQLGMFSLYFVYLAIADFVVLYIATAGFIYTGAHISSKIREQFLAAILRQNIGYFDKLGAGEITTRITADTNLVQDGISQKIGLTLTAIATFVAAFVVGYVRFWKLALILTSTVAAIVLTMGGAGGFMSKYEKLTLDQYAEGGTVAEEVLSTVRNAAAFNAQEKLARQYDTYLARAEKTGFKTKTILAFMVAFLFLFIFANYGLSFWMGSRFIVDGECSLSQVLTIQMAIMMGAFALGNVAPNFQAFGLSVSAAAKIFATIDRKSPLDSASNDGEVLDNVDGVIELHNIRHIYPSRPEVVVMEDVSLHIPAGKTTALVGPSGSGKSTIVGLVERFYDPVKGDVLLDGRNIRDLNLRWLRRQMALVSQEPTLFAATIFENIRHGLIGTDQINKSDDEVRLLIEDAARTANAHDFITSLPKGYETAVGERGFLLSGGQKQRIAIARAVVSDPRVLLLDEATSALDTKSEGVVQAALDKAAKGRTTIVIAHRLSTVKDADNIVVVAAGRIIEQGTHAALIERRSAYYDLVEAQRLAAETEAQARDPEEVDEAAAHDDAALKAEEDLALQEQSSDPEDLKLSRTKTSKSASSVALQKKGDDSKAQYPLWSLIVLTAKQNTPEWAFMLLGLVVCIICGSAEPVQSVFFAKAITALSLPASEYSQLRSQANFWSLMYLMLAIVEFLAYATQGIAFAFCSERLVHRVRDKAFRAMLRQDIAFFDEEKNTAGALASFLSTQTTQLAGMSGVTLGTILSVTTTLIVACIISLAIGWKLSLVCISTVPILLGCGFYRFQLLSRFEEKATEAYQKSASYACEATSAIRTVASLTREEDVWQNYHNQLEAQRRKGLVELIRSSGLYAATQAFVFLCLALGFWYGGTLIGSGQYDMFQFFLCFSAVVFGAQSAGSIFNFAPDMGKARGAASSLKTLFDREPAIDIWSEKGEQVEHVEGYIEFKDVHFRYPTRPEQPVLRGLNLSVKPGQYIALVGASGCGKSTTIALLERFYDPLAGSVLVDGAEITSMNLRSYRTHLALVSQEPTLYQGTIRENILLGADNDDDVSEEQIERACKNANIHDFITSLPDGLSTVVGTKGSMLSGGQKQRIAIARALLRDPKILLLDEATSALDSESERVVQDALDRAAKGRTTIAVAHRLSTIQRADQIYVFDNGKVAERGTHDELVRLRGKYWELAKLQNLG